MPREPSLAASHISTAYTLLTCCPPADLYTDMREGEETEDDKKLGKSHVALQATLPLLSAATPIADTMDKWDQAKLDRVVLSKAGNAKSTTDKVCKVS